MPSITPYIYMGGTLTGSLTDQGTQVPLNTKRIIQSASLVNPTAGVVNGTVLFVDAAAVAHPKISSRPLAINETYNCSELIGKGIEALGKVQALGNGLTFDYTAIDIV